MCCRQDSIKMFFDNFKLMPNTYMSVFSENFGFQIFIQIGIFIKDKDCGKNVLFYQLKVKETL